MSTNATEDGVMEEESDRDEPQSIATIESYETDTSIVFYDAENPLAWVETSTALLLDDLI